MKKLNSLLIVFLLAQGSFAQSRKIIAQVLDGETKRPVKNATVIIYESTSGTVANALGFFELTIEPLRTSIIISSIGYETSQIDLPETNQFRVFLKKEFIELKPLYFNDIDLLDTLLIEKDPVVSTTETFATYPGGWDQFYFEIAKAIQSDSSISSFDSLFQVDFTVNPEGDIIDIKGKTGIIPQSLTKVFRSLNKFNPPIQNGLRVYQYFSLSISGERVYRTAEVSAEPVGGIGEFYKFVASIIRYPAEARRVGIEGKIEVGFIVNKDGSISDVKLIRGIGGGCDEEAIRVIQLSPKWKPGTQRGRPIRQRMTTPIIFKLG